MYNGEKYYIVLTGKLIITLKSEIYQKLNPFFCDDFVILSSQDGDGLLVNEDFTTVGSWCNKNDDIFTVADPNGDQHDDWICRRGEGSVCVKYNSIIFGGKSI